MVYWNMTCDKGFNPAGFHYQLYLKLVKQEALIYLLLLYDAASTGARCVRKKKKKPTI
jgi:hypothetical protein